MLDEPNSSRRRQVWFWRAAITLYVVWLLVLPPSWLGSAMRSLWHAPQSWVRGLLRRGLVEIGFEEPTRFLQSQAYYIVLALVVPYVVCVLLRRGRPADTGWRKPNRYLFRIVGCSYLFAIPFLFWMVQSPSFTAYYHRYLTAGYTTLITYYVVILFCEHFFFEGVMLAAFRAEGRWPAPVGPAFQPVKIPARREKVRPTSSGRRRVAQWFGVACPTGSARGVQRVTRWLGVPDGCVGAILLSGVLFGLIHWGKAGREFLLAFPGGIFLSVLAYRCNSWHAPYLLHAGTVTAAAVMFLAMQK
ncbi:MAG: CPBP family intramembrane metalloprotease [Planctomycetes bacterium]|nr:CPBP family intramembrane metalloprotease [Planctomycetota bacterium]